MKKCAKCLETKEKELFGKDIQKKDGLRSYCKLCQKTISKIQNQKHKEKYKNYYIEYRKKNRETLRIKAREIYYRDPEKRSQIAKKSYYKHKDAISVKRKINRNNPAVKQKNYLRQKEWCKKNAERIRTYINDYRKRNLHKSACHQRVHRAVRDGILIRSQICLECGKRCKTEGHHEDYTKPLVVIWLCRACHAKKIEKVKV